MAVRRFAALPSVATILAVSGIVIVDAPASAPAQAAPTGKVCIIGETEDGPYATPTDLLTSSTQKDTFGTFGFTYGSSKYRNACALRSGGTEDWNGNLWIQTARLKYRAATICRVDTSIGQISLTPRAYVQATEKGPFVLSNGLTVIFNANGAGNVTATFAAAAATHTSTAGTFTSFTGGEILTLALDNGSSFAVQFQPGDTTLSAIISRINTVAGATIASNSSGQLKLTSTILGTGSKVIITASATATTLGLTAGTYSGSGDAANIALTTYAELKAKLEAASALVAVTQSTDGYWRLVSKLGGTGTLAIGAGTANSALGLTSGTSATAALAAAVKIPAGTRANDGGADATRVVTTQTTTVAAGSTATTLLYVRPAVDDGSYAGVAGSAIDTLEDQPGGVEWAVGNPSALSAALTASELDSRYLDAIEATKGVGSGITKKISGIVSARQSNAIRSALKQNAVDASASGHQGRRAFLCGPTTLSAAELMSASAPGVGAYRVEEVSYCAGDIACQLQELIDGGYSTDGEIIRHADTLAAARWSVLDPGENFGQLPENAIYRWDTTTFHGLGAIGRTWDLDTYAAFKQAGICAAEFDTEIGLVFEQAVTAVDPALDPTRVDVGRKTISDFISDSCVGVAKQQSKRLATDERVESLQDSFEGFLDTLVGTTVQSYSVTAVRDAFPGHPEITLYEFAVKTTPALLDIVFNIHASPNEVVATRG